DFLQSSKQKYFEPNHRKSRVSRFVINRFRAFQMPSKRARPWNHVGSSRRSGFILESLAAVASRDLDNIALIVPSGNPVLLAIFRAPIPACWLTKERSERSLPQGVVSRAFYLWLAL